MNAAPENSPESAHLAAWRPRRMRGWWLAALAMFAIIALAAFGWLPPYIALPAIVAVATLMAVEIRSASRGGVWGRDVYIDERTVDVHVGRLRKALSRGREADPIRTVRGTGYSFNERFASGR